MNNRGWMLWSGIFVLAVGVISAVPAKAQSGEMKEKPPMYSYVGNWDIPRAQWGEMEKANAADEKVLQQAMANGTIVAYGSDMNLVHSPDGFTHDNWWSAMSMAGLLNVLDQFYSNGSTTSPAMSAATKHWDDIYVSRHYNYHSGSFKGAYTGVSMYKLKADAPEGAVDRLSENMLVPLLEKLLADGTLHEYEIDTQAVHTHAPGLFFVVYICANAEGLDKVQAAIRQAGKDQVLARDAFVSMEDVSAHRDELSRTNAVYK